METDIHNQPATDPQSIPDPPETNAAPTAPETEEPAVCDTKESPTLRPLGLFEMLRYENSRHADPSAIKTAEERDATSGVLTRRRRSVWDI
ncbi:MAG: hypothetical protein K2G33_04000 [Duncaniella sp.]|nr:hypothetical protein [Duncaniella sp.]